MSEEGAATPSEPQPCTFIEARKSDEILVNQAIDASIAGQRLSFHVAHSPASSSDRNVPTCDRPTGTIEPSRSVIQ